MSSTIRARDGGAAWTPLRSPPASVERRLRAADVPIVQPARDEPWGQRHVFCTDPAGTLIDVVQPIPPSSEWLRANGLAEPVG